MIDAIFQALHLYATSDFWIIMMSGIIIGLIVGVLPGIGGLVASALILPFVFVMGLEDSLVLMMSITSVTLTGGSITAILLNIPGEPGNIATVFDGYPMTQKGEAGRALGAALTSSAAGNVISALVALAIIPLIIPMVMGLRVADMVFIILVGITFIAVLSRGSTIRGLISGAFGLLVSTVGYQASSGIPRFTFGTVYLSEGIGLVPLILGLFAIPEMIILAAEGGTLAKGTVVFEGMSDVWRGVKDVFHHWFLVLRSVVIGFIAGVVPGVGGAVASFIAYGQAKQTSKHPETFGTGNVEGVIAPESANNAKVGGALLTTLALGIPGAPHFAIFLGAFIIAGVVPGPDMFKQNLGLSLTLLSILLVAGIIGTIITIPFCAHFAKLAFVPGRFLAPLTLVMIFAGAYVFQSSPFDFLLILIFGALGLFMTKYEWNRGAFILGFILGYQFEEYLFLAYKLAGPLFFVGPTSLGLIVSIVALLTYEPIRNAIQRRKRVSEE